MKPTTCTTVGRHTRAIISYCQIRSDGMLYDAERDVLATAQFLVTLSGIRLAISFGPNIELRIASYRILTYIFALSYAELTSLQQRRQTLAKELFVEICKPTSCLHYLLPPPRDPSLLTRLRNPRKYPTPDGRTKKNTSLLLILLSSTISKTML